MATVGSLWVGGPLGYVQRLCLTSFIHHGHTVNLYVYDMNMEVPNGVNKIDASTIIPENKVFTYHGQLAAFSDYFRYKMIQNTGLMWVDADTLCLTESFFDNEEFVFINESDYLIAGGILKLPKDHEITIQLNRQAEKIISKLKSLQEKERWAAVGPLLLTKLAKKFALTEHAQPALKVNVLDHWSKGSDFWDPKKTKEILAVCDDAYCGTMFTGTLRARGFDTEQVPPSGSAIEHFAKRFGIL